MKKLADQDMRRITIALIGAVAALLIGYDVLPFQTEADHDTISEVMRDGGAVAAIPFAAAFLAGHFWFRPKKRTLSHPVAIGSGIGLASGLTILFWGQDPEWTVPVVLLGGFVSGGYLWPLKPPPDGDEEENTADEPQDPPGS